MSGTVLDGCTSFYLLTTGVLLFPCRWAIHSLLPLTLPFFLPLDSHKTPPGSIQHQWTASSQQNIQCWCLHTLLLYIKPKWIENCAFAADGSAVKPQIIFIFYHIRMKLRQHTQMMPRRGSSGIASIDRSGLIGGNVERWVKGFWLGSDPCLLADRVCMLTICRATESCWKLQVSLGTLWLFLAENNSMTGQFLSLLTNVNEDNFFKLICIWQDHWALGNFKWL